MPITITRKLAIINGFVEIPNSKSGSITMITVMEALSAIPGAKKLAMAGGQPRYNMEFIEFPSFSSTSGYPSDWFATLNNL